MGDEGAVVRADGVRRSRDLPEDRAHIPATGPRDERCDDDDAITMTLLRGDRIANASGGRTTPMATMEGSEEGRALALARLRSLATGNRSRPVRLPVERSSPGLLVLWGAIPTNGTKTVPTGGFSAMSA